MQKVGIEVEAKVDSFDKVEEKTQSLKTRLKELKEQMARAADGSAEFKKLANEAGALQDRIADVNRQIKNLSSDTQRLDLGLEAIQGVTGAFSAAQGAAALFGDENEELQEAMLKVQSAMALTTGVQQVANVLNKDAVLGTKLRVLWEGKLKTAVQETTTATKIFVATGIGLLIAGIGVLIANWDKLSEAMSSTSASQEALNETIGDYRKGATDAVTATNKVETAFELAREGVISKEEALATYNETLGDAFGKTNDLSEAERLFNAKADAYIEAMAKRAQANALFAKSADETAKALTASQEDQRTTTDNLVTTGLQALGFFASAADKNVEQQKKRVKEAKKTAQENAKIYEDEAKKLLKSAEQVEKANGIKSESEQKLQKEIKKTTTVRKEAVKTELELFEEAQKKLLEDIASGTEYTIDKILPPPDEFADGLDEIVDITQEKFTLMEQATMNWSENFQQSFDNTLNFTKDGLSALGDLVEAFAGKSEASQRRAFKIRKAASIAQTIIETYQAAQSAYASQVIVGDPTSVIRGAIAATIATASGLARVKAISSQQFEGGGASSAAGGSSASPSLPTSSPANFTIVGNSGTNQLAETLTNAPIQAYVVGGEVTTQQSLDRNKVNVATW